MSEKYYKTEEIDKAKSQFKQILLDVKTIRDHSGTSLIRLMRNKASSESVFNLYTLLELIEKDSKMLVPVVEKFVASLDDFTEAKEDFISNSPIMKNVKNFENV